MNFLGFLGEEDFVTLRRSNRVCLRAVCILSECNGGIHSVSVYRRLNCSGPDIDHTMNLLGGNRCVAISPRKCVALARVNTRVSGGLFRHRAILSRVLVDLNISRGATASSTYQVRRIVDRRSFGTLGGGLCGGWRSGDHRV